MTSDYLEILDRISPNLKLGFKHLIPVLEQIFENGPDREKVATAIMGDVFPDKSRKSVFRGMVVPTMTELELARKDTNKKLFYTSPNGKSILLSKDGQEDRLSVAIRDYSAFEKGITSGAIEYLHNHKEELKNNRPDLEAKASRFENQYLDPLEISLPDKIESSTQLINILYQDSPLGKFYNSDRDRRNWISTCLEKQELYQVDQVRWKLMKWQLEQGNKLSFWYVDEVLWKEWNSQNSIIDLWQASTVSPDKLTKRGKPFDGVLLKG